MLTLKSLELSNICQYKSMKLEFSEGLTAITGKNGSGKSTLLRGLMYGLTGIVDGSWGTQANLQKDGTVVPGYVIVTLKADGKRTVSIKRFSTSGVKFPDTMVIEDPDGNAQQFQRRQTVDAELEKMYGIPCSLLFQLCWGRQGQIDSLLTAPGGVISNFLADLFDTKRLEVLREAIKVQLNTVATFSDDCIDRYAKLQEEVKQLSDDYAVIKLEHVNIGGVFDQAKQLYEEFSSKLTQEQLNDINALSSYKEQLASYDKSVQDYEQSVNSYSQYRGQNTGEPEEVAEYFKRMRQETTEAINAIDVKIYGLEKERDVLFADSVRYSTQLAQIDAKTAALNLQVDAVAKSVPEDTNICDACGGEVHDKKRYVSFFVKLLTQNQFTDYEEASTALEDELQRLDTTRAHVKESLEDAKKRTEEIPALLKDLDVQKEKLVHEKACYQGHIEAAGRLRMYLDGLRHAKEARQSLFDKVQMLEGIKDTAEKLAQAREARDAAERAFLDVDKRLSLARQACDYKIREAEEAKKQVANRDVSKAVIEVMTILREAMSKQKAQSIYFQHKKAELNARLATLMVNTSMPFTLRLENIFEFTTVDGYKHPAGHLSGAQKTISAVSLQMALLEVVRPSINLFLFDEPTEALDMENTAIMTEMFARMNHMLPSIGGTMLIVTRDQQLIEGCENIVDVTEFTE